MTRVCVCVVGWHFAVDVFEQLSHHKDLDFFVVSHRPRDAIPRHVWERVPAQRVLVEPNVGYDWGAYQQFLERGVYRDYDAVFMMHDDLVFQDDGWVTACLDLLDAGHTVVGNGRYEAHAGAAQTPWCYAPSTWKPPSRAFQHNVVRGSFVAMTSAAISRIGGFEVFWDWMHLSVGFGNWSLRATCGKIHEQFGPQAFAFLGQSPLESRYVTELVRGGGSEVPEHRPTGIRGGLYDARRPQRLKAYLVDAYRWLCRRYMDYYFAEDWRMCRVLQPAVALPAGRLRRR